MGQLYFDCLHRDISYDQSKVNQCSYTGLFARYADNIQNKSYKAAQFMIFGPYNI